MNENTKPQVRFYTIDSEDAGQRIDNFLLKTLKGVPKSMIYRLLRKGEIRANKKRTKPEYKIQDEDIIRVAPIRISENTNEVSTKLNIVANLEKQILFEDDRLIVINKPSGMAVHGGSGLSFGLIEAIRALRPDARMLELVHRLDRDTSGCLVIAKKRSALRHLHEQLRNKTVQKFYHALVKGQWSTKLTRVTEGLKKNDLKSGERVVVVDNVNGKESETRFKVLKNFENATLIRAFPVTGRTHQIRVHMKHIGHTLFNDERYGGERILKGTTFTKYKQFVDNCFKVLPRQALHAKTLGFVHPRTEEFMRFDTEIPEDMQQCIEKWKSYSKHQELNN